MTPGTVRIELVARFAHRLTLVTHEANTCASMASPPQEHTRSNLLNLWREAGTDAVRTVAPQRRILQDTSCVGRRSAHQTPARRASHARHVESLIELSYSKIYTTWHSRSAAAQWPSVTTAGTHTSRSASQRSGHGYQVTCAWCKVWTPGLTLAHRRLTGAWSLVVRTGVCSARLPYTTRGCGERHTGDTAASRVPQLARPGRLLGSSEGGPDGASGARYPRGRVGMRFAPCSEKPRDAPTGTGMGGGRGAGRKARQRGPAMVPRQAPAVPGPYAHYPDAGNARPVRCGPAPGCSAVEGRGRGCGEGDQRCTG